MLFLTSTDKIEAFLDINTTTTVSYYANYMDTTGDDPKKSAGYINGTTDSDIVAAPAADERLIKYLNIYNGHSVAVVVTIQLDVSGTEYVLYKASVGVGQTLIYTPETGFVLLAPIVTGYLQYVEQATDGTNAGTLTANTQTTRKLTTERENTVGAGCSINAGTYTVTLQTGTYELDAWATGLTIDTFQINWYNSSDAAIEVGDSSIGFSGGSAHSLAILKGLFTITASKNFILRQICQTTNASDSAQGYAAPNNSFETFSQVVLRKVG